MKTILNTSTGHFSLLLSLSEDRLRLYANVKSEGLEAVSAEQIIEIVMQCCESKELLHLDVIKDIAQLVSKGKEVEKRRISKGQEAVPGKDGKVVLLAKAFSKAGKVQIDDKGVANYGNLHLFDNITTGQEVARIYPPKAGEDGIDALGKKISASLGKIAKLNTDRTLKIERGEESYQKVIATKDGYLDFSDDRLSIKTELLIEGNLDFRYGSIDLLGSVKVSGDVLPGFQITARDGIEISGSVEGATLVCTDGDITINGSAIGSATGKIICSGNLTMRRAQKLEAEAGGEIIIKKDCLDSKLRAEQTVRIEGQLIAGSTWAVCGVEAKELGTDTGTGTELVIASAVEVSLAYNQIVGSLERYTRVLRLLESHLGPYAHRPRTIATLDSPLKEKMQELLRKKAEVGEAIETLKKKKETLVETAQQPDQSRVNVLKIIHEGVSISIGDQKFTTQEDIKGPKSIELNSEGDEVVIAELKPIVCHFKAKNDKEKPDE